MALLVLRVLVAEIWLNVVLALTLCIPLSVSSERFHVDSCCNRFIIIIIIIITMQFSLANNRGYNTYEGPKTTPRWAR